MKQTIHIADLTFQSPEFDDAYDVFVRDISPAFLEERDFLRNRFRIRDEGPKNDGEKMFVQDGYTLHGLAARSDEKVVGTIYGHLLSRIAPDDRAVGFVTYLSVLREYRRRGIGSQLIDGLRERVEQDTDRLTGKPLVGMVYEIEAEGKEEMKGYLRKHFGAPLDIAYYQPALRHSTTAEQMQLWFHPLDPPVTAEDQLRTRSYPAEFVISLVRNLLTMEYVGPAMSGFDIGSKPYTEFLTSIGRRQKIGFYDRL